MVPAARTIQYGYAQTGWKDLMTSYNGQSITYDEIGNPLTYRDGMTMTWTGRQLTTLTQNGKQNTYKYDVDGLRLEKISGGVTTQYQYVNGQLLGEKRSNGVVLRYTYDALGVLSGIQYKNAAGVTTNYIVRCTLSGDVDQIYDTKGNLLARYIYDTWGNTLSVTDASGKAITDPLHIANNNPIRYRGYYYDAETGLYYLQSRYYDTVTKRYINPDGYVFTGQDMQSGNMFAYCGNQPVNRFDNTGSMWLDAAGGGGAGLLIIITAAAATTATAPALPGIVSGIKTTVSNAYQNVKTVLQETVVSARFADDSPRRHHIVAQNDYRAKEAREILAEAGINAKTDERNLVTLPQLFHKGMHTNKYYTYITSQIVACKDADNLNEAVVETLARLKGELLIAASGGPIPWA